MRTLAVISLLVCLGCALGTDQEAKNVGLLGNLLVEDTTVVITTLTTSTMTPYCYASAGVACSKRRRRRAAVALPALLAEDDEEEEDHHVIEKRNVPYGANVRGARQLFTRTVTSIATATSYVTAGTTNTVTPVCDFTNAYPLCYVPTSILSTMATETEIVKFVETSYTATTHSVGMETVTAIVEYSYDSSVSLVSTTATTITVSSTMTWYLEQPNQSITFTNTVSSDTTLVQTATFSSIVGVTPRTTSISMVTATDASGSYTLT